MSSARNSVYRRFSIGDHVPAASGGYGRAPRRHRAGVAVGDDIMRLALYQPDIPQNTGTLMRLGACLGVPLDLIEPAGFVMTDKGLARAGMDYRETANLTRHLDYAAFQADRLTRGGRLILLTTTGEIDYRDFAFRADDTLMVGRESAGVPADVHAAADARLLVPMQPGARSLNVAIAAAMVLGEALRQLR